MSEDLSNENVEPEVEVTAEEVNEEVVEDHAKGQETETEAKEEEAPDYESMVAERSFELRRERREREQLEKRLAEIEAQKQKVERPNVPKVPDPFDDDYEQKMQALIEAERQAAAYDAQQALVQKQQQDAELAKQQQAFIERNKQVEGYVKRAQKLGVTSEELQEAGGRLGEFITPGSDLETAVLDSDIGPLLTKYLGANLLEAEKLSSMTPIQAGRYMAKLEEKAAQFGTKKVTQAPEPVDTLRGSGAAPEHPSLKGAQWK